MTSTVARAPSVSAAELVVESPPSSGGLGVVPVTVTTPEGTSPTVPSAHLRHEFSYTNSRWVEASAMTTCTNEAPSCHPRRAHTAAMLEDGTVLVAGGNSGGAGSGTAQLYTPNTDTWQSTGPMTQARFEHSATLLRPPACLGAQGPAGYPCGDVLVVGGMTTQNGELLAIRSAELYDVDQHRWTPSSTDPLFGRAGHTATLLDDGRVLVLGGAVGERNRPPVASAEVYDPATRLWSRLGSLIEPRANHTATLLDGAECAGTRRPDWCGKVLVAGGLGHNGGRGSQPTASCVPAAGASVTIRNSCPLRSAELFDPATGASTATGDLAVGRFSHTATPLPAAKCGNRCGRVLVVGGFSTLDYYTESVETYDPGSGVWSPAASLKTARAGHTATVLPSGHVLVAGRSQTFISRPPPPTRSVETYDPAADLWTPVAAMHTARGVHTATVLDGPQCNGGSPPPGWCFSIFVTGGLTPDGATAGAERFVAGLELTDLAPATGPSRGGTEVTVTGTALDGVTEVLFGHTPAPAFTVHSPTRITAIAPAHQSGVVDVVVRTAGASTRAIEPPPEARFTYTVSQAPGPVPKLRAEPVSDTAVRLVFDPAAGDGPFPPPANRYVVTQSSANGVVTLCDGECPRPPAEPLLPVTMDEELTLEVGDLEPGTEYHYSVQAVNEFGAGPASGATVTTLPAAGTAARNGCLASPDIEGAARYAGGQYSLVGLPAGTVVGASSQLYSWWDAGAGGSYVRSAATEGVEAGRGYWAWFACPTVVPMAGGSSDATAPLGAYHASMVGNPGTTASNLTGHDFAARWDPGLNDGAGGYTVSGYREPQRLEVGEGMWAFAYTDTQLRMASG